MAPLETRNQLVGGYSLSSSSTLRSWVQTRRRLPYFAGLLESEVFVILRTGIWGRERGRAESVLHCCLRWDASSSLPGSWGGESGLLLEFLIKLRLVRLLSKAPEKGLQARLGSAFGGEWMHVLVWLEPWLSTGNSQHWCVCFFGQPGCTCGSGIEFPDLRLPAAPKWMSLSQWTREVPNIINSALLQLKIKSLKKKKTKTTSASRNAPYSLWGQVSGFTSLFWKWW